MRRLLRAGSTLPAAAAAIAAMASLPAHAETFLPPCQGSWCTAPAIDGSVGDVEYANGAGFPLSNFDVGGPNGALRLHLQGEKLYVGLRLPAPTGTSRGGVSILLDADRPARRARRPRSCRASMTGCFASPTTWLRARRR